MSSDIELIDQEPHPLARAAEKATGSVSPRDDRGSPIDDADDGDPAIERVRQRVTRSVQNHSLVQYLNKFVEDMATLKSHQQKIKSDIAKMRQIEQKMERKRDQYKKRLNDQMESLAGDQEGCGENAHTFTNDSLPKPS